jgi:hypothetical protein
MDTLDIQAEGAERKVSASTELTTRQKHDNLNAINTAYCVRENELKAF